jgi:hypothetical protein
VDIDILAALEATPSRGARRCNLGKFLDSIPADTPGRDELIRLVETKHSRDSSDTRSARNMMVVLTSLGHPITENPIHEHRGHSCRCYR